MVVAVIFASGEGKRLKSVSGETPKHLLEIDPENKEPLRRTLIGRLVSQFTFYPEIEKVVVICSKPEAFQTYFSQFPEVKNKVQIEEAGHAYDWKRNIRLLRKLVGDKPGIGMPGDIVIKQDSIGQALKAAKRDKITVFFARTKNRPLLSPRIMPVFYASGAGVPRWALKYNPESWATLPKALLLHGRNIRFAKGTGALNVNTPKDLKGVRDIIKRRRWY